MYLAHSSTSKKVCLAFIEQEARRGISLKDNIDQSHHIFLAHVVHVVKKKLDLVA